MCIMVHASRIQHHLAVHLSITALYGTIGWVPSGHQATEGLEELTISSTRYYSLFYHSLLLSFTHTRFIMSIV